MDSIELGGGRAKPLVGGVFSVRDPPATGPGSVSFDESVPEISISDIHSIIKLGHLPVISPVGISQCQSLFLEKETNMTKLGGNKWPVYN